MTMDIQRAAPGGASLEWLDRTLRGLRGGDPLAPVTVVVRTHYVGLFVRRRLAQRGYANVRQLVLSRLAEMLGAAPMAAAGRRPLTGAVQEATVRSAIAATGAFPADMAGPALVALLAQLYTDIERFAPDAAERDGLAQRTGVSKAAFAVEAEYRRMLAAAGCYSDVELLRSAAAQVAAGAAGRLLDELGPIAVYLPAELAPADLELLNAIGARHPVAVCLPDLGDATAGVAEVGIVRAPDATEEVRGAVRAIHADLAAGIPLWRVAVLYRLEDPYLDLVRDTLDAAGLPMSVLGGRSLERSRPAQLLLGLLRLREAGFRRSDVIGLVSMLPHGSRGGVAPARWDSLSRDALVVRGADQWRTRLAAHGDGYEAGLADPRRADASEAQKGYLASLAADCRKIAAAIDRLAADIEPPGLRDWGGLARWARHLLKEHVRVDRGWPQIDQDAAPAIDQLLHELEAGAGVEPEVDLDDFMAALEGGLVRRRQPEGRLGVGITVGPAAAAVGMEFDRVYVVGTSERAFPSPAPADPIFQAYGDDDPLGRRVRRLAGDREAFAAARFGARRVVFSFPAWDADLRPSYPSPWVVDLAAELDGAPMRATELRELHFPGRPWMTVVASPEQGLLRAAEPVNLAERRTAEADAWVTANRPLRRSPLANRADLPLGAGLTARAARRSRRFTEFDGNLERAAGSDLLAGGLTTGVLSASAIEEWAECPFRYLLDRVLRVEPTEEPEVDEAWSIDAATRGTLIHGTLQRFFAEMAVTGRLDRDGGYSGADRELLAGIARSEFARLEDGGRTGHPLAWENEKQQILSDLAVFLDRDGEWRGELRPVLFEKAFGGRDPGSWPALEIDIAGGTVKLRGYIDRIDVTPVAVPHERVRVIDYKTGRERPSQKEIEADPVVAGTKVQLALYGEAARRNLAAASVESRFWFATSRGEFATVGGEAIPAWRERLKQVLEVIDGAVRRGAFLAVPGDGRQRLSVASWNNCLYCPYDRICPAGRDHAYERAAADAAAGDHARLKLANGDGDD